VGSGSGDVVMVTEEKDEENLLGRKEENDNEMRNERIDNGPRSEIGGGKAAHGRMYSVVPKKRKRRRQ